MHWCEWVCTSYNIILCVCEKQVSRRVSSRDRKRRKEKAKGLDNLTYPDNFAQKPEQHTPPNSDREWVESCSLLWMLIVHSLVQSFHPDPWAFFVVELLIADSGILISPDHFWISNQGPKPVDWNLMILFRMTSRLRNSIHCLRFLLLLLLVMPWLPVTQMNWMVAQRNQKSGAVGMPMN